MRQYRWFHKRIGQKFYNIDFPEGVEIQNREHAETFYRNSLQRGIKCYDYKEFKKLNAKKSH